MEGGVTAGHSHSRRKARKPQPQPPTAQNPSAEFPRRGSPGSPAVPGALRFCRTVPKCSSRTSQSWGRGGDSIASFSPGCSATLSLSSLPRADIETPRRRELRDDHFCGPRSRRSVGSGAGSGLGQVSPSVRPKEETDGSPWHSAWLHKCFMVTAITYHVCGGLSAK